MRGMTHKKTYTALVLFSGGLDSMLAVRILQEQGISIRALHCKAAFHQESYEEYERSVDRFCEKFSVTVVRMSIDEDFIAVLKNPRYGYGSHVNPCIDCRIYLLTRAREYMKESGADFVATGEVAGQRPMSQRKPMLEVIARRAGLEDLLVRPLSAKLLSPTLPEREGWIDRERFYDLHGRSRRPQMALARKFGIDDYPNPAGGCLLTDAQFAAKIRDLMDHDELTMQAIDMLKAGRHFRLGDHTKVIVGRDRRDNLLLLKKVSPGDTVLRLAHIPGPVTVVTGRPPRDILLEAGSIACCYAKTKKGARVRLSVFDTETRKRTHIDASPMDRADLKRFAITGQVSTRRESGETK